MADIIEKFIPETDSTNNLMRRLMNTEHLPDASMIVADFQTAGRGQVGNSWESERTKNLLVSYALYPQQLEVHNQFYLSMAVSNAIAEAVGTVVRDVKIKWPNDVYVGNRKLGGILIENSLRGSQIADTIVGLGLNLNQRVFTSDAPNPVSVINITGRETDVAHMARSIAARLLVWLDAVNAQRWSDILTAYNSRLFRFDNALYPFADARGAFRARIAGVQPDGRLTLIDEAGATRFYMFKEVEFVL